MNEQDVKFTVLFVLAILVSFVLEAQEPLKINANNSCSYAGALSNKVVFTYPSRKKMDGIISEITGVLALDDVNFELRIGGVKNAIAFVEGEKRIILYSENYLTRLLNKTQTDWAAYGVLAHEVGHHLNNHTLSTHSKKNGISRLQQELSADKFSGMILGRLGATLEEAQAAIKSTNINASKTHPSRADRLEAVTLGWQLNVPPMIDRDGDKIPDSRDLCPDEYGSQKTDGCPDADKDGIPNKDDKCPYVVGVPEHDGCPKEIDLDHDGVPDISDKCPTQKGLAHFEGCPDTDGDNIPNNVDKCPAVFGEASNDGCPVAPNTLSDYIETATNPNFKMIAIIGGSFKMGSIDRNSDEQPVHSVSVPDFYLAEFEVTQKLWRDVMGHDPKKLYFKGKDNNPVESVSWDDVQKFIKELNRKTGKTYRLPSEAEWEYAARGGVKSKNNKYAGVNREADLHNYANFCDTKCDYYWKDESQNDGYENTAPVGIYKPNELGLYDMSGNVWEWCEDRWHGDYKKPPKDGSAWINGSSSNHVVRGGSWYFDAASCRVTGRNGNQTDNCSHNVGFRLAISL